MIQSKNQNIYLDTNNLHGYAMCKFSSGFKWIVTKESDWINMPAIVQRNVFSKLILNILKNYVNYIMIIL